MASQKQYSPPLDSDLSPCVGHEQSSVFLPWPSQLVLLAPRLPSNFVLIFQALTSYGCLTTAFSARFRPQYRHHDLMTATSSRPNHYPRLEPLPNLTTTILLSANSTSSSITRDSPTSRVAKRNHFCDALSIRDFFCPHRPCFLIV